MPEKKPNESVILSNGNDLTKKPEYNEIEVSVLGPGYGECVLLHLASMIESLCDELELETPEWVWRVPDRMRWGFLKTGALYISGK